MSKALQPYRRVASKYGDFRYQGPKYSVAEAATSITEPPRPPVRELRSGEPAAPAWPEPHGGTHRQPSSGTGGRCPPRWPAGPAGSLGKPHPAEPTRTRANPGGW